MQAWMRLRQRHVIAVVLDTTYDITFGELDVQHGYSTSKSTRISEIESSGTTAERTLTEIDESAHNDARYHAAAALVAESKHQDETAESEWTAALQLAPENKNYQLQLGILRLRAADPERRAQGEAMLTELRSDETHRCAATRALFTSAVVRRENPSKLIELARDLQSYPEATWNDRLTYLDLLHAMQDQQFPSYLAELEDKAAAVAGKGNVTNQLEIAPSK